MVAVKLVIKLAAGENQLIAVDDDDVVAAVHMRRERGLMLTAEHGRDLRGKAAQHLTLGVDDVPGTFDVLRIRHIRTHR